MNDNVKKRIIETHLSFNTNTCICCGEEIPEGILVCPACERGEVPFACQLCGAPLLCDEQMCSECQARCSKKGSGNNKNKRFAWFAKQKR